MSCIKNTDNLARKSENGESEAVGNRTPNPQNTARSSLFIMSPFFSKFTIKILTNFSKNSQYKCLPKYVWSRRAGGRTDKQTGRYKVFFS